ncbi:MAG: PaaI family thioesterase [Candidatus Eiseniibacteriota bacterium]|nr:MAG: PaaI family thioesterase [Candidatus Eisenbacteria bacterium]
MSSGILNRDLLSSNTCYGCGHENPSGLKIEIRRDPQGGERLVGSFQPPEHMVGFPGITHGGALYTAMDCLSAWTPMVLRRAAKAIWILREGSIKYLRPALQGEELALSAVIEAEGGQWEPLLVRTEARDREGNLLATGTFKVVPLSADKFKKVAGLSSLPANWSEFLGVQR